MSSTRRDLIDAQRAILAHQDRIERDGITDPIAARAEYEDLHSRFYDVHDQAPWHQRIGVWSGAQREHDREDERSSHRDLSREP